MDNKIHRHEPGSLGKREDIEKTEQDRKAKSFGKRSTIPEDKNIERKDQKFRRKYRTRKTTHPR